MQFSFAWFLVKTLENQSLVTLCLFLIQFLALTSFHNHSLSGSNDCTSSILFSWLILFLSILSSLRFCLVAWLHSLTCNFALLQTDSERFKIRLGLLIIKNVYYKQKYWLFQRLMRSFFSSIFSCFQRPLVQGKNVFVSLLKTTQS